jgi:DNA-binding beta-propeller fold protein YncE
MLNQFPRHHVTLSLRCGDQQGRIPHIKTKIPLTTNSVNRWSRHFVRVAALLIALALAWFTLTPQARAVSPQAADVVVQKFRVGSGPIGLAFDGANIWVVNQNDRTVTKLRASDGTNLGTFGVGQTPQGAAYDGTNIWV